MGANEKHAATYHGGKYVPEVADIREKYVYSRGNDGCRENDSRDEFDRMIAKVRAEAKAEALRDAADEVLGYDPRVSLRGIYAALKFRANQYKEQS